MSQILINDYLKQLDLIKRASASQRETIVREAFKDLLKAWGRQHDLVFLAEYPLKTATKTNIAVDGALLHELRLPLGYWEAKDAADDLDEEIGKKFRRGYLMTVSQMTDDVSQRRQREKILRAVVGSVFSSRDSQRGFTPEQRRLLWNSSVTKSCSECGVKLTWDNFSVDHVDPHSRGGRSELENAALVCQSCNSSKGNRRSARSNIQR